MDKTSHPYIVPFGDDRRETATLLVGTADEYGIDQSSIKMTRTGFRITQEMADALGMGDDGVEDGSTEPDSTEPDSAEPDSAENTSSTSKRSRTKKASANKTSGNRAGEK